MTEHTPTPWKNTGWISAFEDKQSILIDAPWHHIARLFTPNGPSGCTSLAPDREECLANAAFIVQAVNAHSELVAAVQHLLNEAMVHNGSACQGFTHAIQQARAALAKAAPRAKPEP